MIADSGAIRGRGMVSAQILNIAQQHAEERPGFFKIKGPGKGDRDTHDYMKGLRLAVERATGSDLSEQQICGDNKLAVDFYVREEGTIIEIALSLRNPNSEFELDILKALMAQDAGYDVSRLIFVSKPGGAKRIRRPGCQAMLAWARKHHQLEVEVYDLSSIKNEM